MKGLTVFTCLVLLVCVLCSFLPVADEMEIYDNTIRLHVLANSDSEHDQSVKLAVRDAVLAEISQITAGAENVEEAEATLRANLCHIREVAALCLDSLGEELCVDVTLSEEYYPTREYEDFRLPAGKYSSLRVMLGEAKGRNWWCVLYPSLCTSSAKAGETLVQTGFSKEQIEILTGGEAPRYRLKFKMLELFGKGLGG